VIRLSIEVSGASGSLREAVKAAGVIIRDAPLAYRLSHASARGFVFPACHSSRLGNSHRMATSTKPEPGDYYKGLHRMDT